MIASRYAVVGDYEIRFQPKPRGASLAYTLDFGTQLIRYAPATISGVSWSVVSVAGDAFPLTIVSQSFALDVSTVQLASGTPLESYSVRGQVSWSDGETDVVEFTLPIAFDANLTALFPSGIPSLETFGTPTLH